MMPGPVPLFNLFQARPALLEKRVSNGQLLQPLLLLPSPLLLLLLLLLLFFSLEQQQKELAHIVIQAAFCYMLNDACTLHLFLSKYYFCTRMHVPLCSILKGSSLLHKRFVFIITFTAAVTMSKKRCTVL
jgi:hypothetical protein